MESVLSHLSLLSELDVVLVENYFLDVMSWHLSHEKGLHVALLEALENLIFETKELKDLLEHGWGN